MATLLPGAVEYLHWTATGLPDNPGPITVSLDRGTTWHPAELNGNEISLLVAHPSVTSPPDGAAVGQLGLVPLKVKLTDTPEVVIRNAGNLTCS